MTVMKRKVFLHETTKEEDFFRFVEREGYEFAHSAGPEQGMPLQYTYRSAGGDVTVRYLIEPIVHLPLLLIWGCRADEVVAKAQGHFDVVGREEILAMYDPARALDDRRKALAYLALLASEGEDQRIVEVLKCAVRDPIPDVRMDAVWVMRYAPWPEVTAIAEQILRADVDARVCEEAQSFLKGYEKARRKGQLRGNRR